jgi:hypothetical protein
LSKTDIRYFTPLIDSVVEVYGLVTAAVLGAALRYCQMEDEVCAAAQEKIAFRLGLSRATINTHLHILVQEGFLEDLTPDARNRPHVYKDTGKANIRVVVEARVGDGVKEIDTKPAEKGPGVKEIDSTVKEIDSGCQGDLHPGVKEIDMKKVSLRDSSRDIPRNEEAPDPASPGEGVCAQIVRNNGVDPPADEILKALQEQLYHDMPRGDYLQYVEPLRSIGWVDGVFRVSITDHRARDWVLNRLGRQIDRLLSGYAMRQVRMEIQVRGQ